MLLLEDILVAGAQRHHFRHVDFVERRQHGGGVLRILQAARNRLAALLPGVSVEYSYNSSSNKYLLNSSWSQVGADAAINLVKLFSLPAVNRSAEAQKKLDDGGWLKISSKSGEFFTGESRAVFIENVVIKSKEKTGFADKAFLDVSGNEIILEGNAKIESDNHLIEGKRIRLFTDDDRIEVDEAEGRSGQ